MKTLPLLASIALVIIGCDRPDQINTAMFKEWSRDVDFKLRDLENTKDRNRFQLITAKLPTADGGKFDTILKIDTQTGQCWYYTTAYVKNTNFTRDGVATGWRAIPESFGQNVSELFELGTKPPLQQPIEQTTNR